MGFTILYSMEIINWGKGEQQNVFLQFRCRLKYGHQEDDPFLNNIKSLQLKTIPY